MFVCGIFDEPGAGRRGVIYWVRREGPMASVQVKQEPSEKEDVDVKNGNAGAGGADTEAGQQSEDNSNDGGQEDNAITLEQLIAENNRMLGLYEKMNARQTVLEEFIEVEYGRVLFPLVNLFLLG